MKRVNLSDLPSMVVQSEVLDQALYLLANSPVQFRASDLCRLLGVHASVLTRMKLVHCNPEYEPFVNQYALIKVLKYLFQCFPTLVLSKTCQGEFVVRLFKRCGKHKLETSPVYIPADEFFKQNAPKPGSTRWYLEQQAQEKLGGFGPYSG